MWRRRRRGEEEQLQEKEEELHFSLSKHISDNFFFFSQESPGGKTLRIKGQSVFQHHGGSQEPGNSEGSSGRV